MIKIKKLLTSLAALGLVASTSSMVVSCGPSFSSLRNRKIVTSVYKTIFNNNIQNWNMAATMQSADFKILANTQDTLMTYDNSSDLSKPIPLLAESVTPNEDFSQWTITLKKDAKWYDFSTGKEAGDITGEDILNTAKYTLDPHNGSELAADWITFVKGAKEINQDLLNGKEADWTKLGVKVNGRTVTISLNSPAKFFDTVLTTGSFAPTPERALEAHYDYGRGSNYKNTLLSGPYYVEKFKNSNELVLKRNPNYKDANKGTVDTIKYLFTPNNDSANTRRLFETKDITEANITPEDSYGYKHYVDGKFNGLEKVDNNLIGSKYLWFNFSKQHKDGIKTEDKESNNALSLESVRTLIAYAMNRKDLVEYFAGSSDDKVVNDFITNTFNPSGYLKIGDKDYTESVSDKKGNEAYYHNDELLNGLENSPKNLDDLINQVNKDLGNKKVTLTFLTSGVNARTFNPYIRRMINNFNDIKGNPITIEEQPTADDAAYQQAQLDGNYSMFITGETPTYIDPMSFLVNLEANGPMSLYNGTSRLFNTTNGHTLEGNLNNYGVNKDLTNRISEFTNELEADNKDTSENRYKKFAETEKKILFTDKTIIPLYKPNGQYVYKLSYMDPDSRPNKGFGYQDYRLDKVKLVKTIQDLIDSGKLTNVFNSRNKEAITKQD